MESKKITEHSKCEKLLCGLGVQRLLPERQVHRGQSLITNFCFPLTASCGSAGNLATSCGRDEVDEVGDPMGQDCFHPQTPTCNTCLHQQPLEGPRQWPQVLLVIRAHREELLAPAGKPPASKTEGEARNGVVGKVSQASEPVPHAPPPWPARPKPPRGQEHSRPGGPSYQCG